MKDVFDAINNWNSRLNLFRDHHYNQKLVLVFSLSMTISWFILGFDSGVGMFEIWNSNWQINYEAYGKSLHFSAFTIYGLLFYGISKHLHKIGVSHSRNVFYTASLSVFNIGIFELWYMGSFATYQMNRNLLEWFTADFWEIPVVMNFMFFFLGCVALLCFYTDSFKLNSGKVVGRYYRFKPSYTRIIMLITFLLVGVLAWVYYPFQVESINIDGWQNSNLFPQTHYAYVNSELYVPNDLLHSINVIVKALFAFTHFYILTQFKKVKQWVT